MPAALSGCDPVPCVPAVGHHPSDRSARPRAPVGVPRPLRGEAAGSAARLPRPPAARGALARPAGGAAGRPPHPGEAAGIRPTAASRGCERPAPLAAFPGGVWGAWSSESVVRGAPGTCCSVCSAAKARLGGCEALIRGAHGSFFSPQSLGALVSSLLCWVLWLCCLVRSPGHQPDVAVASRGSVAVLFSLQAWWRGQKQRRAYLERLRYLRAHADAAVKVSHPSLPSAPTFASPPAGVSLPAR